jgi:hypothetical protein
VIRGERHGHQARAPRRVRVLHAIARLERRLAGRQARCEGGEQIVGNRGVGIDDHDRIDVALREHVAERERQRVPLSTSFGALALEDARSGRPGASCRVVRAVVGNHQHREVPRGTRTDSSIFSASESRSQAAILMM